MGEERVRIYVMTHRAFEAPPDGMYVPVHVGRAAWRRAHPEFAKASRAENREMSALAGYTGDDSGDNISDQNCCFSELTGLYWVWKNVHDVEFVGTCHYRRYLLTHAPEPMREICAAQPTQETCAAQSAQVSGGAEPERVSCGPGASEVRPADEAGAPAHGGLFTAEDVRSVLTDYQVITTKSLQLNYTYYEGFAAHHNIRYLDETARVIADRCPDYYEDFIRLAHEKHTYFGNLLICRKKRYDRYCAWLFDILFELQRRVPVEEKDSYHRRIFGFLSEFLQYVWIVHNRLSVYACMVGMFGEKAEVAEAKHVLAQYFLNADVEGAKNYFLKTRAKRPDLLMEASDITGELHLAMEVIAIAGLEQQAYGANLLGRIRDFRELMAYCTRLNRYAAQLLRGEPEPELAAWAKSGAVTDVAVNAACEVMRAAPRGRFPIA